MQVSNSWNLLRVANRQERLGVLFTGDLCPIGARIHEACKSSTQGEVIRTFRENFDAGDIVVANLECSLTKSVTLIEKVGPHLKADPITARFLKSCSIDVLNLANNHVMDYGEQGIVDTIRVAHDNNMEHVGAGLSIDQACAPLFLQRNCVSVAFLSFCETEFNIAGPDKPGCAPINSLTLTETIRRTKNGADILVVSLHCGSEHYPLPSPRIKTLCRTIAESGATIIICHHTHICEGFEVHNGVPIFFGLGNFLFGTPMQRRLPHWYEGYMVRAGFDETAVVSVDIIPYVFEPKTGRFSTLDPVATELFHKRISFLSGIIEDDQLLSCAWEAYAIKQYREWYQPIITRCRTQIWRDTTARNLLLWHYRTNESHNDIITTSLMAQKKHSTSNHNNKKYFLQNIMPNAINLPLYRIILRYIF